MIDIPKLEELLQAGVHFGHQTSRWHPKMKDNILTSRQGIHIIDLEKTQSRLQQAVDFVTKTVGEGGLILFVSLKSQAHDIVKAAASEHNMPYIIGRWLGGVFTNYQIISKLLKKLDRMEKEKAAGAWEGKYSKKERLDLEKELLELQDLVGGIRNLDRLPKAIFLIGLREGKNAVLESKKAKVTVVAVADTNTNPQQVDYPIPANDDAIKSIKLITGVISEAVKEGLKTNQQ